MLTTTNTEQLFGLACSGNIKALEDFWDGVGDLNATYERFGKKHSLIMGAYRNQQYDTVRWLKNHGCKLTDEEQEEINLEYMRIKTVELLASDIFKKIDNIKSATFTSVWDGVYEVTTNCKVNMETREVFDIEKISFGDNVKILDYQYITLDNEEYRVYSDEDVEALEDTDFWYKE